MKLPVGARGGSKKARKKKKVAREKISKGKIILVKTMAGSQALGISLETIEVERREDRGKCAKEFSPIKKKRRQISQKIYGACQWGTTDERLCAAIEIENG